MGSVFSYVRTYHRAGDYFNLLLGPSCSALAFRIFSQCQDEEIARRLPAILTASSAAAVASLFISPAVVSGNPPYRTVPIIVLRRSSFNSSFISIPLSCMKGATVGVPPELNAVLSHVSQRSYWIIYNIYRCTYTPTFVPKWRCVLIILDDTKYDFCDFSARISWPSILCVRAYSHVNILFVIPVPFIRCSAQYRQRLHSQVPRRLALHKS